MNRKKIHPTGPFYPGNRVFPPNTNPIHPNGGFIDLTDDFIGEMCLYSETDPAGSYTGYPRDDDTPLQDADDL